jgi:hypothetical protein
MATHFARSLGFLNATLFLYLFNIMGNVQNSHCEVCVKCKNKIDEELNQLWCDNDCKQTDDNDDCKQTDNDDCKQTDDNDDCKQTDDNDDCKQTDDYGCSKNDCWMNMLEEGAPPCRPEKLTFKSTLKIPLTYKDYAKKTVQFNKGQCIMIKQSGELYFLVDNNTLFRIQRAWFTLPKHKKRHTRRAN